MNAAQLHLILTHLPIVGLGFVIILNIYAMFSKSAEIRKLTLWGYIMIGIFATIALVTGEGAEDVLKSYPGMTEELIEPHEHAGLFFFHGLLILATASLVGLFIIRTKEKLLKRFNLYLLIGALLVSILGVWTGTTGGEIRHTEINRGIYKEPGK